jgi:hypothetical protein
VKTAQRKTTLGKNLKYRECHMFSTIWKHVIFVEGRITRIGDMTGTLFRKRRKSSFCVPLRQKTEEGHRRHPNRSRSGKRFLRRMYSRLEETRRASPRTLSTERVLMFLPRSQEIHKDRWERLHPKLYFKKSRAHQTTQHHKLHPYNTYSVQELHGDDTDRRVQFCEWCMPQRIRAVDIIFSDDTCFHLN